MRQFCDKPNGAVIQSQMRLKTIILPIALLTVIGRTAAQIGKPSPGISMSKDTPSPILLSVDITDAPRRVLHTHLTIPAKPGELTLRYPQWIPGEHAPSGPINYMAGLQIQANGKSIAWRRDDTDMFAFHCTVPPGAKSVDVAFDFLISTDKSGFSSGASATDTLDVLSWNQVLLYPAGYPTDRLIYTATLRTPTDWKYATSLSVAQESAGNISFKPVSLTTLVDSPVLSGQYLRTIPLGDTINLNLAGDSREAIQIKKYQVEGYRQLIKETDALFGARHYDHYDFLLTLSDRVPSFGLEHHQSSDDRIGERALLDEESFSEEASLLPHEFVHSWNGKYRRPAGLATPDYHEPMHGELLWVYEGLTEYLGDILTARSGLWSDDNYRDHLANIAAYLDKYPGRTWRPLIDTTVAAQLVYSSTPDWFAYRRGTDFYDEGELIWLEADTVIRQQSKGTRSLDDFCRSFHGGKTGSPTVKSYTTDDIYTALNTVTPYDWRGFFTKRLTATDAHAPLGGLENGGWRLVYNETPNKAKAAADTADLTFSLGLSLNADGSVVDSVPGSPAYIGGVTSGMKLVAVNGRRFIMVRLQDALRSSKKSDTEKIELIVENGDYFKTVSIEYHGGERYPHLERNNATADLLGQIIKTRTASKTEKTARVGGSNP